MLFRNFLFLYFFSVALSSVQGAPRVPNVVTQNGLTYCTHATGFSFNPQTADAGANMNVVTDQVYSKLFEIKNHSATLTPVLAQSYTISEDGREIIINLRKGVKFHRTPWFTPTRNFNAEDVVFSINRVLGHDTYLPTLEENAVTYQNPQYRIFHEQAKKVRFPYFESIKLNQKIKSVTALDPYRVKIELFHPDSSILSHLASQYAIIFSQEYAYQLNADDNLAQLDTHPVGTGPYRVEEYAYNQYVRLVRNEDYWQNDAKIKHIVVDLSTDRTGRLIKFLNNECQIISYPDVSQLGLLQQKSNQYYLQTVEGMNLAYLAFNFKKALMRDETIRQAVAQSLNRRRMVDIIYHHTATVANNIIPTISWAARVNAPEFDFDYNPARARQLLQGRTPEFVMWVVNEEQVYNPTPLKMAELIKHDLAEVGVSVKVRSISRTFLLEQLRKGTADYDLILSGWLTGNLDPDGFMRPILSCDAMGEITNLSHWCQTAFDEALNTALETTDLQERAKAYHHAQIIVLQALPIVPIANVKRVLAANGKLKGVELTPFGSIHFATLFFGETK